MAGGHVEALKGLPVTADFSGSTEGLGALFEAEGYYICRGKSFYEFSLKDAVRLFPEKQRELPGGIRPLSGLRSGEISELKDFIESFGWSAGLLNPEIVREEYSFVGFADRSLCESMSGSVDAFLRDEPQFDDMTMLSLTYRGNRNTVKSADSQGS